MTAAAALSRDDSGWSVEQFAEREVGLVVGTMFCGAHTISQFDLRALREGPSRASPLDFANTVINAATGQAAIWHKLRGFNSTISAGSTSGLQALAYAVDMIRNRRATVVMAGGVEELCYETFQGFYWSGALCNSPGRDRPRPIPFDQRRNGYFVSEGVALLMLEEAESAVQRGAHILAEIKGHGSSFDYRSQSRPDSHSELQAETLARSIAVALDDAALDATEVQAVSASGNGSRADVAEAEALAQTFRGDCPPLTAVKGMLGEAMGAGGALQTVALLNTLSDGRLPGIAHLEEPEALSSASASVSTRAVEVENGLVSSVGLDGNCCSLVIGRYHNGHIPR